MPRVALTSEQKSHRAYKQAIVQTKALIAISGIKQSDIAKYTGKSQQAISRELNGQCKLSLETYLAVRVLVGNSNEE